MKSIYSCIHCGKEQIVGAKKQEKRELKKNKSNLEMIYREKPKDLSFDGYDIKEYFKQITKEILSKYKGNEVKRKKLENYFNELELGASAIDAYLEWIRSKGAAVTDDSIIFPN